MNEPINSSSIAIGSLSTFSLHWLLGCGHHTFLVIKGSNSKHRSASASLAMMTPVSSSRWMERGCAVDTDGPIRWRTLQQLSGSIYDFMIVWSSTVRLLWLYFSTMFVQCLQLVLPHELNAFQGLAACEILWSFTSNSVAPDKWHRRHQKSTWYLPVPSAWCCTKVQDQIAGLHLATIFWSCFALCCCSVVPFAARSHNRDWKIQTSMNFMDFLNF